MVVRSAVAVALVFALAWACPWLPRDLRIATLDLAWLAAAVVAGIAALRALRRPENSDLKQALLFFAAGSFAWALGQAVWTYQEIVQDIDSPVFRVADIGYWFSVALLGIGLLRWPRTKMRWSLDSIFDLALLGGFAALFGVEFILDPLLAAELNGLEAVYVIAYPPGEVFLFAMALAALVVEGWHERARLDIAAVGLLAFVVGDAGYTYLGDSYQTGGLLDPTWIIGFLAVTFAATGVGAWQARVEVLAERLRPFVPAAALVLLAAAAVLVHRVGGSGQGAEELFALLGLVVLLAARQGYAQSRLTHTIVEQRRLEQHLQHSQKLEAVGRLAGGVAHDFNNLLTAIDGYSELAAGQLDDGHPARSDIQEIRGAARRAAELTRQLLAFSRRQVLSPEVVDLNAIVVDIDRLLRRLAGEGVRIETVLSQRPACVLADKGQLEQVITNLVVNARDAMPEGGTVTVTTEVSGDRVWLTVADTGVGMTEEVKARLFEPFFTTKEVGKGTGLGLAMVHGILTQSNGEVTVTSAPRRGSTFQIQFPIAAPSAAESTEEALVAPAAGSETVLLVEDEPAVRDLARRMLDNAGYEVFTASCGEEALERVARAGSVDVLVTDLVMPGMNGHELADRLRQQSPKLAVVLMSGYSQDADALDRLRAAGAAFVEKPFTSSGLVSEVRSVLDAPAR